MIEAVICTKSKEYVGFSIKGHAGFARNGRDIVCSSVSALTFSFLNSVEELTDSTYKLEKGNSGFVQFKFLNKDDKGDLLIRSYVLALMGISADYGKFFRLYFKEV